MADTAGLVPLSRWARMPLALGAGLLMALGAPPFNLWPVGLLGVVAAFVLFDRTRPAHFAGTGWAVGLGYFGLSLGWIIEPFLVDAALTGWLAPFGLLGLAGGLSIFWGVAFWAAGRSAVPLGALVVFWGAAELARAYVLTGFPWGLVGYLWLESPAIQWVSVLGPHGMTLATFGVAALCALALRRRVAGLGAAALVCALLGGGILLTPPPSDLEGRPVLRLVQPNAPQDQKWDPDMIPIFFNRQIAFSAAEPGPLGAPDLVIWPETAVPLLLERAGEALATIGTAAQAPVALGIQRSEGADYFNALALIAADGAVQAVYDKHHLVPFGEYMPARWLWRHIGVFGLAARAQSAYSAGPGPRLIDVGDLGMALPLICYEAVFPQDMNGIARGADWLLQVTNDAWFGQFSGPYQHLAQARLRAIEQGLPMVRVANTGVSAMIDGGGRLLAQIPLGEAGYLDAALPPRARLTPYSVYGDLPAALLILLAGLAVLRRGMRKGSA